MLLAIVQGAIAVASAAAVGSHGIADFRADPELRTKPLSWVIRQHDVWGYCALHTILALVVITLGTVTLSSGDIVQPPEAASLSFFHLTVYGHPLVVLVFLCLLPFLCSLTYLGFANLSFWSRMGREGLNHYGPKRLFENLRRKYFRPQLLVRKRQQEREWAAEVLDRIGGLEVGVQKMRVQVLRDRCLMRIKSERIQERLQAKWSQYDDAFDDKSMDYPTYIEATVRFLMTFYGKRSRLEEDLVYCLNPQRSKIEATQECFRGYSGKEWGYDSKKPIGRGGFSVVYLGRQIGGNGLSEVAIKVIGLKTEGTSDQGREIEILNKLARVESGYTIRLHDFAFVTGKLFLVIDKGEYSLFHNIKAGMNQDEILYALYCIANGLQAIHRAGIVHRDLKPENVMRCGGVWKLCDFGISRDSFELAGKPTMHGYMSVECAAPEMWRGEKADVSADLYALGCIGYHLTAGRPPFSGLVAGFASEHLHHAPAPLPPSTDRDLAKLIMNLLSKDPKDRPTCDHVLSEVERLRSSSKP